MTDKINGSGRPPIDINQSKTHAAGKAGKADGAGEGQSAGAKPGLSDAVTITDAAVTLKRVEASLAALPEIDAQRVTTVRQQIDSGAYHINPENVADKLTRFESGLF